MRMGQVALLRHRQHLSDRALHDRLQLLVYLVLDQKKDRNRACINVWGQTGYTCTDWHQPLIGFAHGTYSTWGTLDTRCPGGERCWRWGVPGNGA